MVQINIAESRQGLQSRFHLPLAPLIALLAIGLGLGGCATLPSGKPDPRDRFERLNRSIYAFNMALDRHILRPVAQGYVKVTPVFIRARIGNFMSNLVYPTTLINDFLQGKADDGANDLARLAVNTTIGIGGLFDPASRMGIDRHDQDFGQTLGRWGVHSGPYLMLPLLGPSTVRDSIGLGTDALALYEIVSVYVLQENTYLEYGLFALKSVNTRAGLLDTDQILNRTYDPYAFIRSAYLQRREYLIHDADVPADQDFPDAGGEDSGGAPSP